jgi:CRP-like cAMP-binding protein/di/tricarboxylate transporter
MSDTAPLDSATALARTPLFSQLGRLDLARLAGELEELRFRPGATIVREGDPADGFYVINSGRVVVVTRAPAGNGAPIRVLGPGEAFGEVALLTDSPRTATVIAETDVIVWRLSRARFEALLGHERSIAQSIERTLSRRLAATTQEATALRGVTRSLVARAVSPEARRLMAGLGLRRAWPHAVLARACERMGQSAALSELEALPGLLRREGEQLVVGQALASLAAEEGQRPDPAWCDAVATELAAAGDPGGAVDLDLAARALDRVLQHVTEADARLLATVTPSDVDRWLAGVGTSHPAITERLLALRRRLGRPAPPAAPPKGPAPLLWRLVPTSRAVGALAALAVLALGWLAPLPAGLDRAGLAALAAIVATVPLLVCAVLPDYVVTLLLLFALVAPGLVRPEVALSGFATPAWIMILTLLAVGVAISRSGLMFRLVLLSLERLPGGFLTQSLVLSATGVLMTAGLTSGSTRIALGVPIARGIADAMGFARQSAGSAAIGLLTFFTFLQMGELFLTGTFTGLVVHDLLPAAARRSITWWRWFFVALPVFVLVFTLNYLTILAIFKPHRRAKLNLRAIQLQHAVLGPVTRNEIWSGVTLVVLVAGFATRDVHHVAPAWLAVASFLFLFALGALDQTAFQGGGTLGLLVYSGVILSLGAVFSTLGLDTWLTSLVQRGLPPLIVNPYGFVLVVALIAFVLHFFVPWMTASTLLALVTMPVAEGLGFHPFIPVLVALVAGDHTVLPYVNSGYAILYFASEGDLFSHAQARWVLVLEALYRIAALLLAVPVWRLVGLM